MCKVQQVLNEENDLFHTLLTSADSRGSTSDKYLPARTVPQSKPITLAPNKLHSRGIYTPHAPNDNIKNKNNRNNDIQ